MRTREKKWTESLTTHTVYRTYTTQNLSIILLFFTFSPRSEPRFYVTYYKIAVDLFLNQRCFYATNVCQNQNVSRIFPILFLLNFRILRSTSIRTAHENWAQVNRWMYSNFNDLHRFRMVFVWVFVYIRISRLYIFKIIHQNSAEKPWCVRIRYFRENICNLYDVHDRR